jgi:DNA-binding response OmpR family regulator
VVVTDIRMPGSVTVVDLCRFFIPLGVRVMVVSGVGPGQEQDDITAAGCRDIAMRPLTPDVLCANVAALVARTPSRIAPGSDKPPCWAPSPAPYFSRRHASPRQEIRVHRVRHLLHCSRGPIVDRFD